MKKLLQIIFAVFVFAQLAGCENVPAGYVAVKVDRYGDSRGVQTDVVGPGRYASSWNQDYFLFPEFTRNEVWTKSPHEGNSNDESITFQTQEGTSINADFGVSFHIERANVAKVFTKYRRGIDEISDIYLRNMLRDSLVEIASGKTLDDLMVRKADFLKQVNADVKRRAIESGITVESISAIGDFRWPPAILAAMNAKMEATQNAMRVENELRTTEAEQKKRIAKAEADVQVAKSEAQATELRGEALNKNPAVLKQMWIEKWDGKSPQVISSTGTPFLLNIDK